MDGQRYMQLVKLQQYILMKDVSCGKDEPYKTKIEIEITTKS